MELASSNHSRAQRRLVPSGSKTLKSMLPLSLTSVPSLVVSSRLPAKSCNF